MKLRNSLINIGKKKWRVNRSYQSQLTIALAKCRTRVADLLIFYLNKKKTRMVCACVRGTYYSGPVKYWKLLLGRRTYGTTVSCKEIRVPISWQSRARDQPPCVCMIFLRNTRVMQDARAKVNEEAKVSVANARVRERDYAKYLDNKIESPPYEFSSFRNFVNWRGLLSFSAFVARRNGKWPVLLFANANSRNVTESCAFTYSRKQNWKVLAKWKERERKRASTIDAGDRLPFSAFLFYPITLTISLFSCS